ncbi:protein ANTAGONIST OF LIKE HETEROCHROMATIN PROTEIN 1-like [Rhizophagus clarus]|uniref:Protein ANTAGONIST OF LIKE HETEROCHROMATIN PROTEIN 1-like n=1 Tax=Rhizophagus clarus TaxID=94130 RepID=A0A8H3QTQ1_9GLOM|nr:protein ANTAGONIST OF LIKE HETEROCHROMATIN PROTEIN 1-like [Rhizophagus clarus]
MNDINEIQTIIILIIIIILIKHIELEELLITSYSIEQEEEDFNLLPLILLYLQHNKEINELRKLNRLISNYWFNEFLATGECYRSIGEKFGMGESTISYALRQFFDVIISKFLSEKIIFLTTELEVNRITNGFKITRNFPNVIGAIDDSHIPIKAPHLFPVDYFNRKGFYSIILQAVVDHKKKFLDICVGWPGSTYDSRILINSNLYNKFNNQVTTYLNNKYILGDGGYLNLSWLIVSYKDIGRGLTQEQTYFNRKHSQTRIKVEQAFGLLKERCDFLPPDERYHKVETETDVNRELNTTETPKGNVIRNSICNFLWNQRNTRRR